MNDAPVRRRRVVSRSMLMALLAVGLGVAGICTGLVRGGQDPAMSALPDPRGAGDPAVRYSRLDGPPRTVLRDGDDAVIATMTDGARTVALAGPRRTFADPRFTTAEVTSRVWVRLLPREWVAGTEQQPWFRGWLDEHLRDRGPDVLACAAQYLAGQPDAVDEKGLRYRGDAGFGPAVVSPAGPATPAGRAEDSDFNDYLGVRWTYPDGTGQSADPTRYGDADSSGYVRLVYGYRAGYPLLGTDGPGPGLPRRAAAMSDVGPGVDVTADGASPIEAYGRLQPGDLVFFDLDPLVDRHMDHVGIYLGTDQDGGLRFLSSRGKADGPTFGDRGGPSLLDGDGYYARALRHAKRL